MLRRHVCLQAVRTSGMHRTMEECIRQKAWPDALCTSGSRDPGARGPGQALHTSHTYQFLARMPPLPLSQMLLVQIVHGVRERQPRSDKAFQGTNDIAWFHIFCLDIVVVNEEDAGQLLSLGLPLLMQCNKVSRVGGQESIPTLGGVVQMVGVMQTLRAGAAWCDNCVTCLG